MKAEKASYGLSWQPTGCCGDRLVSDLTYHGGLFSSFRNTTASKSLMRGDEFSRGHVLFL